MERKFVSALRAGMVLPILQFGGPAAFATLVEPDAYYVMTAEHPENSMRLSLAHRNPACARALPLCLTFEARSTPYSVVIRTAVVPDFASNRCIGHSNKHRFPVFTLFLTQNVRFLTLFFFVDRGYI
jgi:hypothetical protein